MPPVTDPNIPPAYVLNTLHAAGYEPYAVDGAPSMYRLPGEEPRTWRECMEEVGVESARLRAEIITVKNDLMVIQDRNMVLDAENQVLTKKVQGRLREFLLTFGTAVPTAATVVFVAVSEQLATVLPQPWGHILGVAGAMLVAKMTRGYTEHRPQLPEGNKNE